MAPELSGGVPRLALGSDVGLSEGLEVRALVDAGLAKADGTRSIRDPDVGMSLENGSELLSGHHGTWVTAG